MSAKKKRSASRKPIPSPVTGSVTLRKIAQVLGIHRTTLENWRNEGCPGLEPGHLDLEAVKKWARENSKRAGDSEAGTIRDDKTLEEIRKLRLANDAKEGRLVERAWVAERIQRASGDIAVFRAKSESEHPVKFAAAMGDVAQCRTIIRGIWDEVLASIQAMQKHFEEGA